MFAYCNNNPVILADASGTASRACITANGVMDEEPWRDHSPSGGGRILRDYRSGSNYYGEVADKFFTVKLLKAVGNSLKTGSKRLWDACTQSYNMQQEAQLKETQMMVDGAITIYNFLDETDTIPVAKFGYQSIQAGLEAKKALAYVVAPIPTPADELLAFGHAIKAIYHLQKSFEEASSWTQID